MSILVVQTILVLFQTIGFGSISAFNLCLSWLCVRLKQSTLLSRVSALNRKMIWCKRQIITPYNCAIYCQPWLVFVFPTKSPFFLRSTSPHDVSPPGRLEGFHQLDLSDEESARQPTAMRKWLGFVSLSWAHDVFEYTTYVCMQPWVGVETSTFVETENSLAGNEWLERPSVFPARMVHIQIENRLGLFLGAMR